MSESEVDIRVEGIDDIKVLGNAFGKHGVDLLLRDAIRDISKEIERYSKIFAPEGETGELKLHPVDVSEATIGQVETRAPLFGGGFAIRGPRGFISGKGFEDGKVVGHVEITVATEPAHAIWVHRGTGLFGPHHTPIVPRTQPFMVFFWKGKWHKRRTVGGQKPQPFLSEATEYVDGTYVPRRVEQLRAAIAALI